MVLPQGQVLVGPLYWLLLVLLMCVFYQVGGTVCENYFFLHNPLVHKDL